MIIKLRSKRLAALFSEVWNKLPKRDRDSIAGQTLLISDNPLFLPQSQKATLGAVICVKFRKSIAIVYLAPRRLARQADSFIKYQIAHELAHIRMGHTEELFRASVDQAAEARFEREADQRAKRWGFSK